MVAGVGAAVAGGGVIAAGGGIAQGLGRRRWRGWHHARHGFRRRGRGHRRGPWRWRGRRLGRRRGLRRYGSARRRWRRGARLRAGCSRHALRDLAPRAGSGVSPRRGRGRVTGRSSRWPTMPVHSRLNRLRSASSAGSGTSARTSRALSVPSMRESRNPSAGVSVIFWVRSRGSVESTSTRLRSPRPVRTSSGSRTLRVASRMS